MSNYLLDVVLKKKLMADRCLTRLCDSCGTRIEGVSYHCPKCDICFCFSCGVQMILKGLAGYPLKCPVCGRKLE